MPEQQIQAPGKHADVVTHLQDGDERYQAFIHNSQEGIWRFEVEQPIPVTLPPAEQIKLMYKYAYLAEANEAMARMYKLPSVKDILGARLGDFLIESDPENIAYLTAFIESGYNLSNAESHEIDSRGEEKYFQNSLVGIIEDGHLVRAWGTQSDITDRRTYAAALKKSEERLALALEASRTGIWEWNIMTGELIWSDQLKKLFGLKPSAKITYEKYQKLVHPDDRALIQKHIQESMKTGKSYSVEHRTIWPDKSVHWILGQGKAYLENGQAARMVGTSMNIDDRKRAELDMIESEKRFRNLADTAPVLIWVAGPDKKRTYFNKPWLDFTGRTLAEEIGDGWTKDIHPDDYERNLKLYNKAFDQRKSYSLEYRLRHRDGTYHWMFANGMPRYSNEGEFLGYIGSLTDIEKIKSVQKRKEELEELNWKLETQRSQLISLNQSKDEFISLASHQLRTPATGVKQYIGMLLEGYGGDLTDGQMQMLRTAYESNERQLTIIDDLLKVAHVDAGKVSLRRRKCNIVKLIDDIIDEQADKFKSKKQTITFAHPGKRVFCTIDQDRMRMVLENLIDNASKYTPEGKRISVDLHKTAKGIKVSVTDEGVGIAKKDIPKLFQKFSRVSNSLSALVGGTGLGLYWAEKIVKLHGGTISVVSKPRKGSTFTLNIP